MSLRIDYALSKASAVVLLPSPGFNTLNTSDPGAGASTAAARSAWIIAKLDEILKKTRLAGKWAVLCTMYPTRYFNWAADDYRYEARKLVNTWIKAQAGRDGVFEIIDHEATLTLPDGTIDPNSFWTDVGSLIHLNTRGAQLVALKNYVPCFARLFAAGSAFSQNVATSNVFTTSVGQLLGTTGNKIGGGGAVATGCTARRGSSVHGYAAAKVGSTKQKLTITPTGAGGSQLQMIQFELPRITLKSAADMLAADTKWTDIVAPADGAMPTPLQWLRAHLQAEFGGIAPEYSTLNMLELNLWDITGGAKALVSAGHAFWQSTGTSADAYSMNAASTAELGQTRKHWFTVPPMQVPAGANVDVVEMIFYTYMRAPAGLVDPHDITLDSPIIRKTTSPKSAWGYS